MVEGGFVKGRGNKNRECKGEGCDTGRKNGSLKRVERVKAKKGMWRNGVIDKSKVRKRDGRVRKRKDGKGNWMMNKKEVRK